MALKLTAMKSTHARKNLFDRKDPGFGVDPDPLCQFPSFIIQPVGDIGPDGNAIPGLEFVCFVLQFNLKLSL